MNQTKTILITGVSSGFGQALAETALAAGHKVIGTVRQASAARAFETHASGNAYARQLDLTDTSAIANVVEDIETALGPVDVLVNNAGYGHEGILEESPTDEMRRQFEVNVFGAVEMIQALLPFFRKRRAGHIINITSMGGFITMPGIAYYCGSKFALEGISDTLSKELAPFNIHVTAVAPGSFRTDWAGRSMRRSPRQIADYDALFDPVRQARLEKSGQQLGDPEKAAEAMLEIIECDTPPAHLLLGSDALKLVRGRLSEMSQQMDTWESLTISTDG
ncbi:oxidoreductase [Chromohalobacter sp. HP20-39]|uniref:oxidoreductase n=1 Tax=Chromohalobacter sp. HP20-39 TaxID=3079306 RepID=UPI00294ACC57|nr:oxidoreductase [Chromohalobacter sp. HP20-39]MDV6318264.1 oxidoreductase [Chromohalobacter sp. HP20-39]